MTTTWRFTAARGARAVDNVADLRRLNGAAGDTIALTGYYAAGDGGGGLFRWDPTSTSGDDDGTIIVPTSPRGRWVRFDEGAPNVRWWGAKGDNVTDDTAAIQAAIDYLGSAGGAVYFPNGVYKVTGTGLSIGMDGPVNSITLRGEVPCGHEALERLVVDGVIPDVGTMIRFAGTGGVGALLEIGECDMGSLENLAFVGGDLALYCVRWRHAVGERAPYCWTVKKCSAVDARTYNWKVEGTGVDAFGDASGLTFEACFFPGSHSPCETVGHFCNSTQYTFGVTFIGCVQGANAHPLYALDMHSGTANVIGGDMQGATACIRLYGGGGDFPAVNVYGVECQSSGKFLVTDATTGLHNTPNRSSTIVGLLADDINSPIATEMIYWSVAGEASLTLIGCNIFGDVNVVSADGKVFVEGSYLRGAARFTGAGQVVGHWYQGNTPGVIQHRFGTLPSYADNAAAVTGGLAVGDLYKTSAGAMRVVV